MRKNVGDGEKCEEGVGSVGNMGRCVCGVGEVWEVCWGWREMRRSMGRGGCVGRCCERSRECKKVWER